jgi:hypothetical protein
MEGPRWTGRRRTRRDTATARADHEIPNSNTED